MAGAKAHMAQEQVPSHVIPVLVAVLICDAAVTDPGTGKKNLIGIFDRIFARTIPTEQSVSVYVKLADAIGRYKMEVRFVQVESGRPLIQAEGELQAPDRLQSMDFFIQFQSLPLIAEGRFEFQVWANSVYLGGTFLDVVPMWPPKAGDAT